MDHHQDQPNKSPPPIVPPLPRDPRGSLEVFNPSGYTSPRQSTPVFRPQPPSWKSWAEQPEPEPTAPDLSSKSGRQDSEEITTWMALKEPPQKSSYVETPPQAVAHQTISAAVLKEHEKATTAVGNSSTGEVGEAAQRAAEWGLVLKTDDETGKLQGVKVRTSGDELSGKSGNRRESGNSVRTSGDMSDDGTAGKERGFPRVSEDLKDALSTFQQTFVVSDATKPDFPIMYASAGFFKMTGYTSKEVIGRNCRFLQGKDTDSGDVAKIRESLQAGSNYCGRLLNYKKDGTPFWNLLTIAPIKDDTGKVLKFIGMQMEVSKHTEGYKDKSLRPNGLPESLIRYDARQKEMATTSVAELLHAVKRPRAMSESANVNRPSFVRKSEDNVGVEHKKMDALGRRNSDTMFPPRRNSHAGTRTSMQKINELPEKKPIKKSSRRSFMG